MYQSTREFIAASRTLKHALLTCLVAGQTVRIETGSPGSVPCVLDKPNRIILNAHYALQMVPADASEPSARFLARQFLGKSLPVVTSYDSMKALTSALDEPCVLLDIRSESRRTFPESVLDRACLSVSLHMPPDAVMELLNFVAEGPEFGDQSIYALKAAAGTAFRTGSRLREYIVRLVLATVPGTEEHQSLIAAGLDASFGVGVTPRGMHGFYALCCADAAVRGMTEFSKADMLRLVQPSLAHRIHGRGGQENGSRPLEPMLTRAAEWAFAGA